MALDLVLKLSDTRSRSNRSNSGEAMLTRVNPEIPMEGWTGIYISTSPVSTTLFLDTLVTLHHGLFNWEYQSSQGRARAVTQRYRGTYSSRTTRLST